MPHKIVIRGYIDEVDPWELGFATPQKLACELQQAQGDEVILEINSPGGSIMAAFEMINLLKSHREGHGSRIITRITGGACSAAALLFLAGEHRQVYKLSYFMQHRASALASGNRDDLRGIAEMLSDIDEIIAADLAILTGRSLKKMNELLAAGFHVMGGEKIVKEKLATQFLDDSDGEPVIAADRQLEGLLSSASYSGKSCNHIARLFKREAETGLFKQKKGADMTEIELKRQLAEQKETLEKDFTARLAAERARVCELLQLAGLRADNDVHKAIDGGQSAGDFAKARLLAGVCMPQNDPELAAAMPQTAQPMPQTLELSEQQEIKQKLQEALNNGRAI